MLSKLLRPCGAVLCAAVSPRRLAVRSTRMLPASQYDMAIPKKFHIMWALVNYWELIPLVDVVFTTHSRENISRTMNLRFPTSHQLLIINQRYEPWPELQDVLDKMVAQERRLQMQMDMCAITKSDPPKK